jgi:hypothetical protein
MLTNFLKKFLNLPVLVLLFLLIYLLGSRQSPSASIGRLAASPSLSLPTSSNKSCRVIAPLLNVRSSPNGQIIGKLKQKDALISKGSLGEWVVTTTGYVYSKYLKC